jgi:hypothetical protein
MLNRVAKVTAGLVLLGAGAIACAAADYYVSTNGRDASDGSQQSPWASLSRAAAAVRPGDTVHVAPGVYAMPVTTAVVGAASARIRFISDVQWGAVIATKGAYTSWKNEGDYVDIMGFDITGDGSLGLLNMGSHVRIIGNKVHDVPVVDCTKNGGAGIMNGNYSASDNDIIANIVSNIGSRSRGCPRVHGIYHANRGGHIWNNISSGNEGWGIHLWHAANAVVVANNLAFENGEGGIKVGAGDSPGGVVADDMIVSNNILIRNTRAIAERGYTGHNNLYSNNVIYANERGLILVSGKERGTISADPQLVDSRPTALKPQSGTPMGAPPMDIEGRPRLSDRFPEIGPFESGTKAKPWPWM